MRRGQAAPRFAESRWGGPGAGLLAILAGAAALRLVGVQYGLPLPVLNPDEASIVPRSWQMANGGGFDPNWFDYPTLVMYLLAPSQIWAAAPSYLGARLVVVALGLGAVAASWWLGRRAYGPAAGAVAAAVVAVATTHVAYSRMAVTDVPLTLGVAVSLAFAVSGRLELAGIAAGLATSAKYPGVFLLAPLLVVGWHRKRRLFLALVLAAATFFATSPYVLVHPGDAAGDALRVQRLARDGWLGFEHDHFAAIAFVDRLWEAMGPTLVLAVVALVVALVRRERSDLVLATFVLVYFVDLLTVRAHFDRYVLPLVPALAALAGRLRWLAPVTLLLLVVPLTWAVRDARRLTKTDTRVVAHDWIAQNLPAGADLAADPSTFPPERFRVVPLALPGPGRPFDARRDVARLRAEGVDYAIVTGAVADRVLAARERYPREARFYDELARATRRLYYKAPADGVAGPWVAVYRL